MTALTFLDDPHSSPRLSGLWAACVLPGDGPEYRFTGCPRRWRRWLDARRLRRQLAGSHREMHARGTTWRGGD